MRDIKRLRESASPASNDIGSQAMPLPTWCHQGQQSASSDGLRHRPVQTKSTPRCRSAAVNPYGAFQPQLNSCNTVLAVTSDDRSWIRRISGVHRPFPSRNGKRRFARLITHGEANGLPSPSAPITSMPRSSGRSTAGAYAGRQHSQLRLDPAARAVHQHCRGAGPESNATWPDPHGSALHRPACSCRRRRDGAPAQRRCRAMGALGAVTQSIVRRRHRLRRRVERSARRSRPIR
jgi:hypothetical protein